MRCLYSNQYMSQTLHGTAIYAYIGVVLGVNVGIYGIHGVSGCQYNFMISHILVMKMLGMWSIVQ